MKLLVLLLLLSAPARAATLSTLEVLRGLAADQGVAVQALPDAPRAKAMAVPSKEYEGTVRVLKSSPQWRRPKEALKDRSLLLEDTRDALPSGKQWAWLKDGSLSRALAPGSRAWVKGRFGEKARDPWHEPARMLDLSEVIPLPGLSAKALGAKAQNETFSVALARVDAWCDHMPTFAQGLKRQYLVVSTTLSNKTDHPVEIRLDRLFLSFGADSEGTPVSGLSVRGHDGRPSGRASITLEPGITRQIEWRGDGLFPENAHDKTLYVTLSLSAQGAPLFVRGRAVVLLTE